MSVVPPGTHQPRRRCLSLCSTMALILQLPHSSHMNAPSSDSMLSLSVQQRSHTRSSHMPAHTNTGSALVKDVACWQRWHAPLLARTERAVDAGTTALLAAWLDFSAAAAPCSSPLAGEASSLCCCCC